MRSLGRVGFSGPLLWLFLLGGPAWAQEELFDDPGALEASGPVPVVNSQQSRFLETGGTNLGGRFWGTFTSEWWADPGTLPTDGTFRADLGTDLTFDARPSQDYRVFGKVRVAVPQETRIRELFADVQLGPGTQVRVGKQTMKSGVGYFFSPADFLSLASIDPTDPEQEREGPLAIKAGTSLGTTNINAVLLTQDASRPQDVGLWGQIEGVWGDWEWGSGALVKKNDAPGSVAPRAMATLTGSLAGIQSFSEVTISYGSDKNFVELGTDPGAGVRVFEDGSSWFVSWTSGIRISDDEHHLSVTAQWYQNGEGYSDTSLLVAARKQVQLGRMAASDLLYWSRSQGALGASAKSLGGSDLNLSVFWLGAPSSGRVTPEVSYTWQEHVEVSLSVPWAYGPPDSEYAPQGSRWGLSLELKLGAGSF